MGERKPVFLQRAYITIQRFGHSHSIQWECVSKLVTGSVYLLTCWFCDIIYSTPYVSFYMDGLHVGLFFLDSLSVCALSEVCRSHCINLSQMLNVFSLLSSPSLQW